MLNTYLQNLQQRKPFVSKKSHQTHSVKDSNPTLLFLNGKFTVFPPVINLHIYNKINLFCLPFVFDCFIYLTIVTKSALDTNRFGMRWFTCPANWMTI